MQVGPSTKPPTQLQLALMALDLREERRRAAAARRLARVPLDQSTPSYYVDDLAREVGVTSGRTLRRLWDRVADAEDRDRAGNHELVRRIASGELDGRRLTSELHRLDGQVRRDKIRPPFATVTITDPEGVKRNLRFRLNWRQIELEGLNEAAEQIGAEVFHRGGRLGFPAGVGGAKALEATSVDLS